MVGRVRDANDAWEALLEAHAVLLRHLDADDLWSEVSMREYDVLYTLSKSDTPLRLGVLQGRVLLSQPALSRLVDRLERRGLTRRSPDPHDRRGVLVALTDSGRDLQRRVGRRHARSVAAVVTASLDEDDIGTLGDLCRRLAQAGRSAG